MATKTTIRFELYSTRTNAAGLAPVRIVYALKGHKKYLPTPERVWAGNWNTKAQEAVYLSSANAKEAIKQAGKLGKPLPETDLSVLPLKKDIDVINANLAALKQKIRAIESNFELNNQDYKLQDVIDIFNRKEDEAPQAIKENPKVFIVDFIRRYIDANQGIIKHRTLQTYVTLAKHLQNFGIKKKDRVTFENIDHESLKALHRFFVKQGMNNTTISKQFSILKALIKVAIKENKGLPVCQDFRDYTVTRKDGDYEVISLEQSEFDAIIDLNLTDHMRKVDMIKVIKGKEVTIKVSFRTLDKARDLFIFGCVTGLRVSDIQDLRREHIRNNAIMKKAVKTGQPLDIPLNAISSFILARYEGLIKPLPEMSNQKLNDYIKVLGQLAGINTPLEKIREYGSNSKSITKPKWQWLSSHTARKTFSSLTLEKGGAAQNVMSLTGHKKFASFKRYMNISRTEKQKTMNLWGEIEQPKTKMKAV